jgi:transposase
LSREGADNSVTEDLMMGSSDFRTLTELLDLDGFEVVDATADRSSKLRRLTVTPIVIAGLCRHCGQSTDERHACHDREVVDLPLGGWKTQLVVRLFQFRCGHCDKFFTPPHPVLADGLHATERFLERLAEYASHGDISNAARFTGVPEKTAERWYYDYLERKQKEPGADLLPIRSLGIDELSLKKDTGSSAAS